MNNPIENWLSGSTVPPEQQEPMFPAQKPKEPDNNNPIENWLDGPDPSPALDMGTRSNPDEVAKNKRLSEQSGLPLDAVQADPKEVERQVRKQQVDELIKDSPITRNWFSVPDNAAIAHDSAENLTSIEGHLNKIGRAAENTLKDTVDIFRLIPAAVLGIGISYDQLMTGVSDFLGIDSTPTREEAAKLQSWKDMIQGKQENIPSWFQSGIQSGTQTLVMAPLGAAKTLAGMGLITAGQSTAQAQEAGLSPGMSLTFGAAQGVVEVLTEKLPIEKFFGGLKAGDSFLKLLGKQMITEVPGEQVATALQDMNEWLFLHPEKTINDYLAERPNAALETALATVTGTVFQSTVGHIATKYKQKLQNAQKAKTFGKTLNAVKEQVDAAPVTPRSPETIIDHVSKVAQDSNLTDMAISIDAFTELGQKLEMSPFDVATQLGVRKEFEQNYMRGGDVPLSPEKFAALLLNENWNVIAPHIRQSPNDFTPSEADDYEKTGLKEEIEASLNPEPTGKIVYHGSYQGKFDKFDPAFIGTGTGIAGRGVGIYVTESQDYGEFFKHVETDIDLKNLPDDLKNKYGAELKSVTDEISKLDKQELSANEYAKQAQPLFKKKDEIVSRISKDMKDRLGFLYQVELTAKPEDLLNWDAPNTKFEGKTGEQVFKELQDEGMSEKDISDFLAAQGVAGVQYSDGSGVTSYAIFDVSKLNILKRNGEPITQADIDVTQVEKELGVDGIFRTAEEAGLTPEEYMFYLADLNRAHEAAVARQNEKLLKDAQRKVNKEYKALRKDVKEGVREGLTNAPVYQVINSIQKDRINRSALAALLGDEKYLKDLPKQQNGDPIYTNKGEEGGLDPSVLAEMHGFPSAADMVLALMTAKPFKEAVEETTDAVMKQRYPDLTDTKQRLDAAVESITNDAHTEVLVSELNRLRQMQADAKAEKAANKTTKEKKPMTAEQKEKLKQANKVRNIKLKVLKMAVTKALSITKLSDIRVAKFTKAAKDYGAKAAKALRKGDIELATDMKFKQIVNFIMSQQAYKIQAKTEKDNKYLRKFSNNKSAPKIKESYINSIRQILGNYNLGARLGNKLRKKLTDWVADMQKAGGIFEVPGRLLSDQLKHWGDLTLDEWNTLVDSIKNIETQGRNEKFLGKIGQEVDFEHAKQRLLATVQAIPSTSRVKWEKAGKTERSRDKAAAGLSFFDSALVKVENLLRYLDGTSVGEWYKHMFKPVADAQNEQLDMVTKQVVPLIQKIGKWPKVNKQRLNKKVYVAGLNQEFTYSELLILALNTGNLSNLTKVIEGHNSTYEKNPITGQPMGFLWTEQGILDAMAYLSPVEAHWVQEVWDYLESLRPAVAAVYEAENGHPAEALTPRSFTIGGVKVKGGYFPMMYKYAPGHENALGALQDSAIRASVYSGMTKERTGFVAPVDLEMTNLLPALERNIHFITHYRAVRDNLHILQDNDLVNAIRDKMGEQYVQELRNWNSAVASGNMIGHTPTYVDKAIEFFRRGLTQAVLGLSWTTGVSQLFGYTSSIAVLGRGKGGEFSSARGMKYMLLGATKYLFEPNSVKQAMMLSGELRHRLANTDRELGDAIRAVRYKYGAIGAASKAYNWWNKMALTTISGIQTYCVDIPTWIGAFNQGLDDGLSTEDAVQHADHIVRTSQGTGHIKDLSAIQRKKGVMRALTMFSTYSLVLYNMQRESVLNGKKFPISSMSRMLWAIAIPAMLDAALRGQFGPDDDDDEDNWFKWFLRRVGAYSANSVPLVGTGIASWMQGYSYRASPLEAIPDNAKKMFKAVETWLEDGDELDFKTAEALVLGFGTALGISGTTQAGRLLDAMSTDDPTIQDYLIGPRGDE